tara:strand:- start:46 stop:264 length:219 start_codon:yes stop_codon:yes gene_type:complete
MDLGFVIIITIITMVVITVLVYVINIFTIMRTLVSFMSIDIAMETVTVTMVKMTGILFTLPLANTIFDYEIP